MNRGQAVLAFFNVGFDPASQAWLMQDGATVALPGPNPGIQAGEHGPALRALLQDHSAGYKVHS